MSQDVDDLFDEVGSRRAKSPNSERARAANANGGLQWRGQFGHLAFPTFGRDQSITHLELLPVFQFDDSAIFSDLRLFVSNDRQVGGNVGVGYRQYVSGIDQVLGASLWYDADNSLGQLFQQGGLSLEALGDRWDLRSNLYLPFTTGNQVLSSTLTNSRFSGNQILFDQIRRLGEALPGVDVEFGFQLPTAFAREHELRLYAGAYHFEGDGTPTIDGYRARLQGDITDNISAQVEYTRDDTFGSNVIVGGSIILPGSLRGLRERTSSSRRHLQRFIQRNYNVIVSRSQTTTADLVAMNAATGRAYSVQHVSSSGTSGAAGTATDPFDSVAEAQTAGADLLFVHAGSVLNEAIVLSSGQSLLGEGIAHTIQADGFGTIVLPTATSGTTLPVLQSVAGDAIALASNTRVSGFTIDSPTGSGLVASGATNFSVADVTVRSAGQEGLFLQNVVGPVSLTNLTLQDAAGAALRIDGSEGSVVLTGAISNAIGRSLRIENVAAGSVVNLSDATVEDSGAGLLVSNIDGELLLNDVTVTSSTGIGIEVNGGTEETGKVTFSGTTSINAANGSAISVQDTAGTVLFNKLNVNADAQTGLFVRNAASLLIAGGDVNSTNGGAIADIEGSATDIRLRSVLANGGAFGVRIVDSTGLFGVFGNTNLGTGGLIQNTTTAVQLQNAGTVVLQLMDFDANQTVLSDVGSSHIALSSVRVTNTPGTATAILSLQNTQNFEVANSTFSDNDLPLLDASYSAVNGYVINLVSNTITSDIGDLVRVRGLAGSEESSLTLSASNNLFTLNQLGTKAFDVDWTGTVTTTLGSNTFTGNGGSNMALLLNNASTTGLTTVTASNNLFTFNGGNDCGLNVTSASSASLSVASNSFDFNGANGTGLAFTLPKVSTILIDSNLLNDDGSGATGVLFSTLADLSQVSFSNNLLQFNTSSVAVDRGFILSTVETDGTVILSGSLNNVISGATTPFFAPAGSTSGGFFVNGSAVP